MRIIRYFVIFATAVLMGAAFIHPAQALVGYSNGGTSASTPSPTPSPAFIGAVSASTPGSNPTPALPSGTHAGDCAVIVVAEKNQASFASSQIGWAMVQQDYNWSLGAYMLTGEKLVTPSDISNGYFRLTMNSNLPFCIGVYRYVTCSNDGIATNANSGGSTAPQPNSITTTLNGDLPISVGIVNGNTRLTYTTPSSYTNAAYSAPVTGTAWGCYEDYKTTAQSSAGATQPGAGTLSASNSWGAFQFALPNRGGTP